MSDNNDTILAELDVQHLQSRGLVGSRNAEGTRRIHKRRLNRFSDEENADIPLTVSVQSSAASDAFATIPDHLISHASLVYVGFSRQKASDLWAQWTDWPPSGPRREVDPDDGYNLVMTFIDFITGPFDRNIDASGDDDQQWRECLNTFGMASEFQEAIMDPLFKYLRLTSSCAFWAKDTVEMRYAGLKDIQRASRERERSLRRASGRSGGSSSIASPSNQGRGGGTQHESQRSVSGFQRDATPGIDTGEMPTRVIAARNAPGYTVLYKGLDQARIQGLFGDSGRAENIQTLLSNAPSDFSGTRALFYFSPNYKVAEYHAAYAKRRADCEAVVIVRILVPNSAIERLGQTEIQRLYWPNPEWRELIWRCRTKSSLPSHLRKYRLATLIIGTISRKPNSDYLRMSSWEEVDERCVLKVGDPGNRTNAIQFVFSGEEDGQEFIMEHCRDGISVLPYMKREFEEWVVEAETQSF